LVDQRDNFNPLSVKKVSRLRYTCGGTLINRWYILTAAHCQDAKRPINKAALGDWDTKNDPDCDAFSQGESCQPRVQIFDVEAMIVHEGFRQEGYSVLNDIALVKLAKEAILNEGVQLACLPLDPARVAAELGLANLRDGLHGKRPHVVGWGFTDGNPYTQQDSSNFKTGGTSASQLQQELAVPVLTPQECRAKAPNYNLEEYQICAGGELGEDSCKGDSGGPLYISKFARAGKRITPGGLWYLYGVVSYGSVACGVGMPGVYTR